MQEPFQTEIAQHIWETRYRDRRANDTGDTTPQDTWRRVARALTQSEKTHGDQWRHRFFDVMKDLRFLPGGRILAGAGTARRVTLMNCFVMGRIADSLDGICAALREGALTMQQGGGVGYDFSTLRPFGETAGDTGNTASGPVSFMHVWDAMCATLLSTGARRGAMMATLRCDHPDVLRFIEAKAQSGRLSHFNLSVLITDEFMAAVRADQAWSLVFPASQSRSESGDIQMRPWPGFEAAVPCRVHKRVPARQIWRALMRSAYETGEPGVLFIDQINRSNNLHYCEHITATNPCGEVPLPPYGACVLGSINLTRFVRDPFTLRARLDWSGIAHTATIGVHMLDNAIDVSGYPLPAQQTEAQRKRRIGLGITGLADVLLMLGLHYGQQAARDVGANIARVVCHASYRASIDLAREKGAFSLFDRDAYLESAFIETLPDDLKSAIYTFGIRNSHLLAFAPAGTISLLADNVSSGIEPVFGFHQERSIRQPDGTQRFYALDDYAFSLWRARHSASGPLPDWFVEADRLAPADHLAMQAALQPYVDNAISKTVNVPKAQSFGRFCDLYSQAYDSGLKGFTAFRTTGNARDVVARCGPVCHPDPSW
ncbi:MAG: adenosylcobalamin-dependent ribonucleoside-diphosphate reductase [Pseudomonadota bacterium]|nr:adenosylcobalamin-dependent ribonucleoside-diphosphate reductase [Pseudomonadota bacterium]